jgi:hypothetical protein
MDSRIDYPSFDEFSRIFDEIEIPSYCSMAESSPFFALFFAPEMIMKDNSLSEREKGVLMCKLISSSGEFTKEELYNAAEEGESGYKRLANKIMNKLMGQPK